MRSGTSCCSTLDSEAETDQLSTVQEVDASETAQIMSIDSTFFDITSTNLETFRHPDPKKRHLTAVEVSEVQTSHSHSVVLASTNPG